MPPETRVKNPNLEVRPIFLWILALFLIGFAGYVYLPKMTSDLMLSVIEWKANVAIKYEKRETHGFFWVRYSGLSFQRSANVKVLAREAIVHYNILNLIFKRLDLRVTAKGIQVRSLKSFNGKSFFESFQFSDSESKFRLASKRRIRVDYLRISGTPGSIFVAGHLQEKVDVDLRLACFLSQDFLLRLPKFIQENLFRENELPLKHFSFNLKGKWFQPSIDFESDLIEFNFKARE